MGKKKYIETPEKLYELFKEYKASVKAKPFKVKDWVGKDAEEVMREKEKPLTMEGFECFIPITESIDQYFSNANNAYDEYVGICTRIKKEIREDQVSGGMAGLYNPSITQRLNGLVDKQEVKSVKVGKDLEDEEYK